MIDTDALRRSPRNWPAEHFDSSQNDRVIHNRIATGSENLRLAIEAARSQRPLDCTGEILWNDGFNSTTLRPNGQDSHYKARAQRQFDQTVSRHDNIEARRVHRDPCPRCNIRADIGCKHRRPA